MKITHLSEDLGIDKERRDQLLDELVEILNSSNIGLTEIIKTIIKAKKKYNEKERAFLIFQVGCNHGMHTILDGTTDEVIIKSSEMIGG